MAYTYNIPVTVRGGRRAVWDSVWDGSGAYSEQVVGIIGGAWYQSSMMFDKSSVAGKTITGITLKLTVASGTIPADGTQNYPICDKADSSTTSWKRSSVEPVNGKYIRNQTVGGGTITANNTLLSIDMGTTLPTYGYVAGPRASSLSTSFKNVKLASTATLAVTTNETYREFTLAYNANGGSGAPSSTSAGNIQVNPSCTFTVSSTIPTRTGYTFLGWSTSSTATTASYAGGSSITVTSAGTTTLYAVWKINTYTISYNANGGTGAPASQTKTYGVTLTLSSTKPTRANSSAGSSTVTYNANGGSVSPASATAYHTYSYSFSVWNTLSNGSGTSYNPGANYTTNAAATLYAQWGVTYNNGSVTLPTPSRSGYTFNGWYTAASGGTKVGNAGASYTVYGNITLYAQWTANVVAPTFTTQPSSKSVYRGGAASLSVVANTTQGTITYQWQNSSNNSSFSNISGATSASYSAPTSTVGTLYYRCVATSTKDGVSAATYSNSCSVAVSATPTPTITTQPSSKNVNINGTATLTVAATVASGSLSYQWYSSTNNSSFTAISGATSTSYSAPTSALGTLYYKVRVTNTLNGYTAYTDSNSASVSVGMIPPTITTQPSNQSVITGTTGVSISVTATGNSLSYQWQSSTNNSTFSNISGATASSYAYPTSSAGTKYYRCVVTNTVNGYTSSLNSSSATIIVSDLTAPAFTTQPVSATYDIGITATALKASATSNGTVTYQWQSSANGTTWSNISGATSTSYTPPTSTAGTTYYRCVATATGGSQTSSTNSSTATITVRQASAPVFAYDLSQVDAVYNAADIAEALNGTATATYGTITYQWQKQNNSTWVPISGATSATYTPTTTEGGTAYYRVIATNHVGTSSVSSTSGAAKITVNNVVLSYDAKWSRYLNSIGKPFVKLARLDFLNPNGSVLYTLDNNPLNEKSRAFIQSGEITVNLQNGQRRNATVTLSNLDGTFDYSVNRLWFGQQVRLWEGMILPDGTDFYISQGVFYVKDPDEVFEPGMRQTTLHLVDKWAYLDGTLFGNLDGTYEVPVNSNIFNVIASLLLQDRGNGQLVDSSTPIFTEYYNGKTTTLPDGSTVPLTNTPYTYRCDSENGTYADIILEMNTMLAGWIGYDANGQLRMDPSQDDILDTTKPVLWRFSPDNSTFLGASYTVKNSEVYNDIIVIGESLSDYGQTAGRATNYDPRSDTNVNIIGRKTKRYQQSGYYTQDICESLAVFKLKRESVLKKSVSIKCSQMFHIQENNLVTIERTDKYGNPIERHLVTGYSRPIAQNGEMTINAVSCQDFPVATITTVN